MAENGEQKSALNEDHKIKSSNTTTRPQLSWWREWRQFALRLPFLPCFLAYFILVAGLWGAMLPTLSVYTRAKGIAADEMALLSFLSPILALVVKPAASFVADKTQQHRLITTICVLVSGISFSLMIAVPVRPFYFTSGSNFSNSTPSPNSNGTNSLPTSFPSLLGSTPCATVSDSAGMPTSGAAGSQSSVLKMNVRADATFLLMLLFWTMAFLSLHPLFNMIDALTFVVINRVLKSASELEPNGEGVALTSFQTPPNTCNDLHVEEAGKYTITKAEAEEETKQETKIGDPATITTTQLLYPKLTGIDNSAEAGDSSKDKEQVDKKKSKKADIGAQSARAFGYIRLGGSAGDFLMAVSIAIAALLFASSSSVHTHFVVVAIIYDLCSVLTAVTVWFFRIERPDKSVSLLPHLGIRTTGKLLSNWQILLALVLCFVEGIFFAQTETFLWWYLEEIGAGPAMRYTIQLVTVLLELPIFFFAHHLIEKIGYLGTHLVVLGAYTVRFVGYWLVPSVPWNLPFDFLQSVTFDLQLVAMITQMGVISPPEVQSSAQGLAAGVYFGLGYAAGQLFGGFVYEQLGPRILFAILAAVSMVTIVAFGGLHLILRLVKRRH